MSASWSLDWSHGRTTVHAGGGAIGQTDFRLPDGRRVNPFHEAPWIARGVAAEPPALANLRGDWPCLPFGRPYEASDGLPEPWATAAASAMPDGLGPSDRMLHGYGANADWSLVSNADGALVVGLDYPGDSLIRRVTKAVRPVSGVAAIDVSVEIAARRPCALPFGFHPNFALRGPPGSFRIEPGPFRFGLTHPARDGVTHARPDTRFDDLAHVPLQSGGAGRFDRLPFADDREEIVQLCGLKGGMRLVDEDARVVWTLTWDTGRLPSCLLWMSNRGRRLAPWGGENLCLGVEPVAAAFDLGPAAGLAHNPISQAGVATAVQLAADATPSLGYRLAAAALP